jgi:hypothetical protein
MSDSEKSPGEHYQYLAEQDALRRGLSPEEYGVYKGSEGSLVKPVNSAGGLLILSIILTVIGLFVIYLIGVLIAQSLGSAPVVEGDSEVTPVMWIFIIGYFVFPVWSWIYYAKERRAQKLRIARGLPRTIV